MADIGVFRSRSGFYYTCCCRVIISSCYDNCPRCKKLVISSRDRYESTEGAEYRARQGRLLDRYMASGKHEAGIIAAKLKGEAFVMPHLCSLCGDPEPECRCNNYGY